MGRIQSDIGLVTGMKIGETVDKLMALAAKPRDMLTARNKTIQGQSTAITELTGLLLAVQYVTDNLGKAELYARRFATSSDNIALGTTVTGTPAVGTYQFTTVRTVQSQQLLSDGFDSQDTALGAGTLRLRLGGDLERSQSLSSLRGGQGIVRGKIRITDRSGATADVDLSYAQTVEDVLRAINDNANINVRAEAHGDGIRLVDQSGGTAGNLKVQEVGGGLTAASLGLAGIDDADGTADGQSLVWLSNDTALDALNDGLGASFSATLPDIEYTLRDGATGQIDLSPILSGSSTVKRETKLGQVLEVLNAAAPGKLKAEIAADGKRLKITDLTSGTGSFSVAALSGSQAVYDLGLDGTAVDGVIEGRRLLAGVQTVLLSRLEGGAGLGTLGDLLLTDRSGDSATVDLAGAETLDDVIQAINAAGLGITASLDRSRTGIELADTTGSTSGPMVVANGDATNTADKLHLAVNDTVTSVHSGDLHFQIIGRNTKLADLNGGAGVAKNTIIVTDSAGRRDTVDLRSDSIQTVGDLLRALERSAANITADINETGDGIIIRDAAHGSLDFKIQEGGGTTAADLHLLGGTKKVTIGGQETQVVDGSATLSLAITAADTLKTLRDKINALGAGIQTTILNDGSAHPYRLTLTSQRAGRKGSWVIDSSDAGFNVQETIRAQDALMVVGRPDSPATNILVASSSNQFVDVLPGATLEVKQNAVKAVSVTVSSSDIDAFSNAKTFVDNYNKFRKRLKELTAYDAENNTASVLTGDATAKRFEQDLSRLVSGRFLTAGGAVQTLGQVGITLDDDGTLKFDEAKFHAKYAADPEGVKKFLSDKDEGLSARFHKLLTQLAGETDSLVSSRLKAIQDKTKQTSDKIDRLNKSLDKQREALYLKFYRMELAISKIQSSLTAIQSIQYIQMPTSSSNS